MLLQWMGRLAGLLIALVMVGVFVYTLGVKAHLWQSPPDGFWVF
jgi:hypothetical protein